MVQKTLCQPHMFAGRSKMKETQTISLTLLELRPVLEGNPDVFVLLLGVGKHHANSFAQVAHGEVDQLVLGHYERMTAYVEN